MSNPLRFAVAGCGVIGRTHAEIISSLPDADLCAVVDPDASNSAALGAMYSVEAYTDLGQMLAHQSLDVVTVCVPSGLHGEVAIDAMRAGCHVVVEKPMEIQLDRIDRMLRVQQEMGVKLAVISQRRFDPAVQLVRSHVNDGSLGRIVMGNANLLWWRSQSYYDSGGWRGTWAMDGGGALMNQGIHLVDLLLWLMGPVRTVTAHTGTLAHRIETEDTAVAALEFDSGALGTIVATTSAYPGVTARLEVLGDRGSAVIENEDVSFLQFRGEDEEVGDYGKAPAARQSNPDNTALSNPASLSVSSHAAQIADMIAAIRDDRDPAVDGHDARIPVELILAIYESARTGLPVTLS